MTHKSVFAEPPNHFSNMKLLRSAEGKASIDKAVSNSTVATLDCKMWEAVKLLV